MLYVGNVPAHPESGPVPGLGRGSLEFGVSKTAGRVHTGTCTKYLSTYLLCR